MNLYRFAMTFLMRASARNFILKAAGAPQAPYFLLIAQKKVGKEKGTLLTRPAASLRFAFLTGARQLAALKHASLISCQKLRRSTR